jgi:hypothetical protein
MQANGFGLKKVEGRLVGRPSLPSASRLNFLVVFGAVIATLVIPTLVIAVHARERVRGA